MDSRDAPRDFAENELTLKLSTWEEYLRNSKKENEGFGWPRGTGPPRELAENEPKLSFSTKRKLQGIPKENEGFGWPKELDHRANSQKMNLNRASV